MSLIYENQFILRPGFALGGLLIFWSLSLFFPYRKAPAFSDKKRWLTNLAFGFGNGLLIKILIPFTLVQIPLHVDPFERPVIKHINPTLWFFASIVILDMALYWQHRITHKVQLLWRLHRVHHSDIEIDTTSGGRFHTLEIFFSLIYKAVVIMLLHVTVEAIIVFEILVNFASSFNHSNFKLPASIEKVLRLFLITPALHRIHHSIEDDEMNSNFGFSTSLWDRIFGSYQPHSKNPPSTMPIGLEKFRDKADQNLASLLVQPFSED